MRRLSPSPKAILWLEIRVPAPGFAALAAAARGGVAPEEWRPAYLRRPGFDDPHTKPRTEAKPLAHAGVRVFAGSLAPPCYAWTPHAQTSDAGPFESPPGDA